MWNQKEIVMMCVVHKMNGMNLFEIISKAKTDGVFELEFSLLNFLQVFTKCIMKWCTLGLLILMVRSSWSLKIDPILVIGLRDEVKCDKIWGQLKLREIIKNRKNRLNFALTLTYGFFRKKSTILNRLLRNFCMFFIHRTFAYTIFALASTTSEKHLPDVLVFQMFRFFPFSWLKKYKIIIFSTTSKNGQVKIKIMRIFLLCQLVRLRI